MKTITIIIAVLAASIAGSASAETYRFPADRVNHGVYQVDIAWWIILPPWCAGRWSIIHPAGLRFDRSSNTGGNLRGNPGRGTYDVALKTEDCPSIDYDYDYDYVSPGRTTWHKVVVY